MTTRPINNEGEYKAALARLDEIFTAPVGTPESDETDVLTTLVENYEAVHYPIDSPDPIAAIRIRMEEKGLRNADLEDAIGSKGRVSEILNKRRPLTVPMVHALSKLLNLSAETLVKPYDLNPYSTSKRVTVLH